MQTPEHIINSMGDGFQYRYAAKPMKKHPTDNKFSSLPSPYSAFFKITRLPDRMMPTTAARSSFSPFCQRSFLYNFSFIREIRNDMIQPGRIHAHVAKTAPGIPYRRIPTKEAALTAIGPGVISAMARISTKVSSVSQLSRSTISS